MNKDFFCVDSIDFYDWDELERIQDKRSKKEFKLMMKSMKGDKKAEVALSKHRKESAIFKERAEATGYYWG